MNSNSSTDRLRILRTFVLAAAVFWAMHILMDRFGWLPKPVKPDPAAAKLDRPPAKDEKEKGAGEVAQGASKKDQGDAAASKAAELAEKPDEKSAPKVAAIDPAQLILGSLVDRTGNGYHLWAQLEQAGAGVDSILTPLHEAEHDPKLPRRLQARHKPLRLIEPNFNAAPSFSLNVLSIGDPKDEEASRLKNAKVLDETLWEVELDAQGRAVRPLAPDAQGRKGEEARFKTTIGDPAVTITKTYRLRERSDALELTLEFASPTAERVLTYQLDGPHGIPIEGAWYTSTFREVFVGQMNGAGISVDTKTAYDVANNLAHPERYQALPMRYAGIENQYFAVFLAPEPAPAKPEDRWDAETTLAVVELDRADKQKSDVTVRISSTPVEIGPNRTVAQTYRIFAGPKTVEALAPFGAADLASYRKGWQLWVIGPAATYLAKFAIAPLLGWIYAGTKSIASIFGGTRGSYGIAIILLTLCVRLCIFPLSRKQALSAKKMQDLQPELVRIKEQYKDDKERQGRETMDLWRKNGVNPFGGCLLALIQLPIFIGLWQSLNNSVALRQAPFLIRNVWISDLAAPDMLFRFPITVPLLGDYFNLLPFVVVGLFLFQMKLFSPPPTTPEAEMQMTMMKVMTVMMAFMFYKVPSGLGVYFITSSLWSICERLLLPKAMRAMPAPPTFGAAAAKAASEPRENGSATNGKAANADDNPKPKRGFLHQLREQAQARLDELQRKADQDRTHRNAPAERETERSGQRPPRPKQPGAPPPPRKKSK